jgi:hypothetical protein
LSLGFDEVLLEVAPRFRLDHEDAAWAAHEMIDVPLELLLDVVQHVPLLRTQFLERQADGLFGPPTAQPPDVLAKVPLGIATEERRQDEHAQQDDNSKRTVDEQEQEPDDCAGDVKTDARRDTSFAV